MFYVNHLKIGIIVVDNYIFLSSANDPIFGLPKLSHREWQTPYSPDLLSSLQMLVVFKIKIPLKGTVDYLFV